jgi:hypothetical protein
MPDSPAYYNLRFNITITKITLLIINNILCEEHKIYYEINCIAQRHSQHSPSKRERILRGLACLQAEMHSADGSG